MRSRLRTPQWTVGVIVAILAVLAVGVSSASAALPEFQLEEGLKFPAKFSNSTGALERMENTSGNVVVQCMGAATTTGQITSKTEVGKVVESWPNCKNSYGESIGTITSVALKGHLGYINKAKKEVGLELEVEAAGEEPVWTEFNGFFGDKVVQKGHLIGAIGPVNTPKTKQMKLTYEEEKGVQKITKFEGGPTGQQLHWTLLGETQNAGVRAKEIEQFSEGSVEIKA